LCRRDPSGGTSASRVFLHDWTITGKEDPMAIRATGTVERVYVRAEPEEGTLVRLAIPAAEAPKDGYFRIELDHPNYFALYSLALSAAINRYRLQIRTKADIDPDQTALVSYMVVDW
jgi:hypothetical protein